MGVTSAAVHPSDQTLNAYGLGKLDDASAGTVSKHLEDCDSCQRRVAELSSDEFLGRLQNAHVTPDKSAAGSPPLGVSSTEGTGVPVAGPSPVDTLPPELVDHPDYEIVRELGRGGMGVVYLARNKLMGRLEVLKVVGVQLVERPGVRDRFLREVQSAAKLQHKNIVAAYSAVRLGEGIVLAMECIDGEDLAKMVKSREDDPRGRLDGTVVRVIRGGGSGQYDVRGWYSGPGHARSAFRWPLPVDRNNFLGFRVARVQSGR